ncbi:gamma-glutamyltransferase family protein [Phytomonospora endophytica]|uniref:Gamma-glutamyltranspeptidase/glutathione hydrolase n=1 Tax=Phytomonospora endophytica TaxID=714109 RepID=A0A841FFR2_9ACTN|nr:gamma-glutamyltransferase [Phytomonospora endophytica]MBB6032678.1 gamma-glutamyltranspeptidase/glutathione hydrolase [Phytomonospora endophytica]
MTGTQHAPHGMVCSADRLASSAGVAAMRAGGSAVDAAIATNAVLAVTAPHLCGLGGDLFALVHHGDGPPAALNSSGRAGSGADPERLRAEGHTSMPLFGDIRAVTVPGCVDGWAALHGRYGKLPLDELFATAIGYAEDGFPASPLLVGAVERVAANPHARDLIAATAPGATVRRPGVGRTLRAIAAGGREAFYGGEFGEGLIALGGGEYVAEDLARGFADWVDPLRVRALGHDVWTIGASSQGYLLLLALAVADGLPLPADPDSAAWAHLLIESARVAGYDRPEVLHENADLASLLDPASVSARRDAIDPDRRLDVRDLTGDGDTTYLCAVDADGMGVSLIQSNASGFGSGLFEPATGIGLHNRGLGFNLADGHAAEYRPGRRPPHTLAPALVTRPDGSLRAVTGTMGGDTQPQILLQLLTRVLRDGQSAGTAMDAPRWRVGNVTGFDTWADADAPIELEEAAPASWDALTERGHRVARTAATYGHAQLIEITGEGMRAGASDPRAVVGGAVGY